MQGLSLSVGGFCFFPPHCHGSISMTTQTRRDFLLAGTATGSGLAVAMAPGVAVSAENGTGEPGKKETKSEVDVSPAEDLMREHGLLKRILLIYGECLQRLQASLYSDN
jgi:hypothetical protein